MKTVMTTLITIITVFSLNTAAWALCSAVDLTGTWYVFTNDVAICNITIGSTGTPRGVCSFGDDLVRQTGGRLIVTSACAVSGTIRNEFGVVSRVVGALDRGKTVMTGGVGDDLEASIFTGVKR
jgi:hypothetical protein